MDSQLNQYIQKYGGKHGVLEFLKNDPKLGKYILPSILFSIRDDIQDGFFKKSKNIKEARKLVKGYENEQSIIRTSIPDDYYGLIDVMPTMISEIDFIGDTVSEVREKCRNPLIGEYAEKEGTKYNPDDVTVSIAPYIRGYNVTITQHPNQQDILLVDIIKNSSRKNLGRESTCLVVDPKKGEIVSIMNRSSFTLSMLNKKIIQDISYIFNTLQEKNILDGERTIQIETMLSFKDEKIILTQVRDFAKKQIADWKLANGKHYYTALGITPPEGTVFNIIKHSIEIMGQFGDIDMNGLTRKALVNRLSEDDSTLLLLRGQQSHAKLSLEEYPHENMKAYCTEHEILSHQNTRFVKAALERNGIAFMDSDVNDFNDCNQVNIQCNGIDLKYEKLE